MGQCIFVRRQSIFNGPLIHVEAKIDGNFTIVLLLLSCSHNLLSVTNGSHDTFGYVAIERDFEAELFLKGWDMNPFVGLDPWTVAPATSVWSFLGYLRFL